MGFEIVDSTIFTLVVACKYLHRSSEHINRDYGKLISIYR